jgi:hypothetical protein
VFLELSGIALGSQTVLWVSVQELEIISTIDVERLVKYCSLP